MRLTDIAEGDFGGVSELNLEKTKELYSSMVNQLLKKLKIKLKRY
jgi:hypothetical protein